MLTFGFIFFGLGITLFTFALLEPGEPLVTSLIAGVMIGVGSGLIETGMKKLMK